MNRLIGASAFAVLLALGSPLAVAQTPRSHVGAGFDGGRAGGERNAAPAPARPAPGFNGGSGRSFDRGGTPFRGVRPGFPSSRYYAPSPWVRPGIARPWYGPSRVWGGGYWRGSYWPRAYYRSSFPLYFYSLPSVYATYWYGRVPYYYVNNAYYIWDRDDGRYIVTDPPPVSGVSDTDASVSDELFVYPRNGQDEQQQQLDRRECEDWADDEAGADSSSSDRQRALIACLDGRGYTAK